MNIAAPHVLIISQNLRASWANCSSCLGSELVTKHAPFAFVRIRSHLLSRGFSVHDAWHCLSLHVCCCDFIQIQGDHHDFPTKRPAARNPRGPAHDDFELHP